MRTAVFLLIPLVLGSAAQAQDQAPAQAPGQAPAQPHYRRGTLFIEPGSRATVGQGGAVVGTSKDHPVPAARGAMGTFGGWFGTPAPQLQPPQAQAPAGAAR